jgi:hypothetical protein
MAGTANRSREIDDALRKIADEGGGAIEFVPPSPWPSASTLYL